MLSRDTLPGLCYTNNPPLGTKHHRLMSAPSPRDICWGQDISIASQSESHPDNLTFNFLCIAQHIVIHSPVAKFLWNQYNNNTQAQVDNSSIDTISEFNRQHEYVKYYTIFRASFPMIDGWYQPLVCTWPTIISSVTGTSWPRIPADVRCQERDVSHNDGHTHPAPDIVCIPAPLSQSPGPEWPDDDDYERCIEDVLITSLSHVSPT